MVARSSQKIIVIGKGGLKLKEVGTAARLKLEQVCVILHLSQYLKLIAIYTSFFKEKCFSLCVW